MSTPTASAAHAVRRHDLSSLAWTVSGFTPTAWKAKSMELGFPLEPEVAAVPAKVPGSVQGALRAAGILPDWFEGLNARACEWVENRDWVFATTIPDAWFADGAAVTLDCGGLDGPGVVVFNKKQVGSFDNAFIPHRFDLSALAKPSGNVLHIIFFVPPRWLGQVGYTSQMKDWKPRFNYTWDWVSRLVQIGPWEPVVLEVVPRAEIAGLRCRSGWDVAGKRGSLVLRGSVRGDAARVRLVLRDGATVLRGAELSPAEFAAGVTWDGLAVAPWWPNGAGERALYAVDCELLAADSAVLDRRQRSVGFKHVEWRQCANAPAGADPWICVVNGTPLFLQGIDWTPLSATFADLDEGRYRSLVELYRDLGCNVFRVWGGAFLEKEWFWDLCDRHGFLVWQEFPLSSSGHENWPHEDEPSMAVLENIARSYIERVQHRPSLLMWCGGNELQGDLDGSKTGTGKPVGMDHPLMRRWGALVESEDPGRRFVPTSSSGPRFMAFEQDFGKGLHWDVHGPWKGPGADAAAWRRYWRNDDSLFRSETGAPGTSSAALIRRLSGGLPTVPGTMENPLWRRFSWWLEWGDFVKETGREPASLDEYVAWSQARQATALTIAMGECKARFPGVGGMILWMGHDAWPCVVNTAIIDAEGKPKPAALALAEIWRKSPEEVRAGLPALAAAAAG